MKQWKLASLTRWIRRLLNRARGHYDPDLDDVKPCPEHDCMLRLDHHGGHRYGADDSMVRAMQEIGKDPRP